MSARRLFPGAAPLLNHQERLERCLTIPEAEMCTTRRPSISEVVLNVSTELDLDLSPQHETERTAEIFRDLRLAKSEHKLEPLFTGKWE